MAQFDSSDKQVTESPGPFVAIGLKNGRIKLAAKDIDGTLVIVQLSYEDALDIHRSLTTAIMASD